MRLCTSPNQKDGWTYHVQSLHLPRMYAEKAKYLSDYPISINPVGTSVPILISSFKQ